jgi:L-seryl-tRNA(Ser) seleniumtransferase
MAPLRRNVTTRTDPQSALRRLPQMSELLEAPETRLAASRHGRGLVATLLRERLSALRAAARDRTMGEAEVAAAVAGLPAWVEAEARDRTASDFVTVINATGVVLHTNLGRAPLPADAVRRVAEVASHYSTLEYDLASGRRGSRGAHLDRLLRLLFPGHASLVVNNNAAALLLALNTLAQEREVIVSRGELVEIGGSFRVPEILAKSGALLREVGTTNRTRLRDYEHAIGPRTALLLKVHPSNYRVVGFTAAVPLADLAALARRKKRPLLMDQGSGNLTDLAPHGVRDEPTVRDALAAGADAVCFSADKLLGGPQAGILIGRPPLLDRMRKNPLARALRPDKMIFAALESVLRAHVRGAAEVELPVLRMIALPAAAIDGRARRLVDQVRARAGGKLELSLRPGLSVTGGGSAPGEGLPTTLVAVRASGSSARTLEERLRRRPLPIIARVEAGDLLLDLRTVTEEQDTLLAAALAEAASEVPAAPAAPAAPVRR